MNKSMLISGGSRGIGRATALLAARRGWCVTLTYRSDRASAEDTAKAIEAQGGQALAVQGDVADESAVIRCFDSAIECFGGLHAVVVNAGIVGPSQPLAEMSGERIRRIIDTNIIGALLVAREAARRLPESVELEKASTTASIVLISSAAARHGSPQEYVDYAASKGAIDTLTLGLSKELATQGIRVNAVRPGLIATDIHASGGQPDRAERLSKVVPLGRPGTADEIANAIVWLCSDEASYCTGSILDVAGGR